MIAQEDLIRALLSERINMLGYIQSLIKRHDLAEDVFQDVCAAVVRKRDSIIDDAHLRRWMRTVARRQVLNVLRKRSEQYVMLDADVLDLLEPVWDQQDAALGTARAEALRFCVGMLSKAHQELVRKRFVENYEYSRLASEINRTVDSLYVTFSRIYASLGRCISGRLNSDSGEVLG